MQSPAPVRLASETLWQVLRQDRTWIGIHAAEALLGQGEAASVERFFSGADGAAFPRVGRLRVLAQAAHEPARSSLAAQIETIFLDPGSPDRKQAIESLAKLRLPLSPSARAAARSLVESTPLKEAILPLWSLHYSGDEAAKAAIAHALGADDPIARQRAGYALRWIGADEPAILQSLATAAARETRGTLPRVFLVSAALTLRAGPDSHLAWKQELVAHLHSGPTAAAYEAGLVLAPWLDAADIDAIIPQLEHSDGDTRIAAALLILQFHSALKPVAPSGSAP